MVISVPDRHISHLKTRIETDAKFQMRMLLLSGDKSGQVFE